MAIYRLLDGASYWRKEEYATLYVFRHQQGFAIMKRLLLTCLGLTCLILCSSPAYACFCIRQEVPEALKQAKAVFLGEVTEIVEPKNTNEDVLIQDRFLAIKFKIENSWKGIPFNTREFSVLAAQGRSGCFAFPPMNKGERYLVYANPAHGTESWGIVTRCTRTIQISVDSNLQLLDPDAIDPSVDMKMLDAITGRASTIGNFRFQRRRL